MHLYILCSVNCHDDTFRILSIVETQRFFVPFFSQYEFYDLSSKITNILQFSMIYAIFRIEFTESLETSRKIN